MRLIFVNQEIFLRANFALNKMSSSSFKELFDVSPKQREIIQWRDARRKELRQKYLKEIHNPMKQTMPVCVDNFLTLYNFNWLFKIYFILIYLNSYIIEWNLIILIIFYSTIILNLKMK